MQLALQAIHSCAQSLDLCAPFLGRFVELDEGMSWANSILLDLSKGHFGRMGEAI